jgi:uncharacterized small protein (DUF1192 family)
MPHLPARDKHRGGRPPLEEIWAMDWDEVLPKPRKAVTVGEDLKVLSVAELEERIRMLEQEIGRVRNELQVKRAHEQAAAALFKR